MSDFNEFADDVIRLKNGQEYSCQEIADYVSEHSDGNDDNIEDFISLFYDELDEMDLEDILYAYEDWSANKQDGIMAEDDDEDYRPRHKKNVPDRWDEEWNNEGWYEE